MDSTEIKEIIIATTISIRQKLLFVFLFLISFHGSAQVIDTNIVLVNLGHLSRNDIARQLEIVKKCQPKVIALDVTFTKDSLEQDSTLIKTFKSIPNLVMICDYYANPDGSIRSLKKSHPKFTSRNLSHGGISSSPYKNGYAVFSFTPFIQYGNESYPALGITLAKAINPVKTAEFLNKNSGKEWIPIHYHFPQLNFTILQENQVLKENFDPETLRGKVVVIGFLGPGEEDLHTIPMKYKNKYVTMYGARIHALIAYTILHD